MTSFIGVGVQGTVPGVDTRGGNTWPEIVGQLRIDQAWGGFHIAANVMNNHVAYNCGATSGTTTVAAGGCSELSGNPSDKVGGGVTAAFRFNVPTGVNDALYIGGTWSKGASTDVFANIGQGSTFGHLRRLGTAPDLRQHHRHPAVRLGVFVDGTHRCRHHRWPRPASS